MIEKYNNIRENYLVTSTEGYGLEKFKALPFKNDIFNSSSSIHNYLINDMNDTLRFLLKDIKNVIKEIKSEDYSHAAYGLKEKADGFKRERYSSKWSDEFSFSFSQFATIADEIGVDYNDLLPRLENLCKISKEYFSFFDKAAELMSEYVQLETYIKDVLYSPEELEIYKDDINSLVERFEDFLKNKLDYIDYDIVIRPQIREFETIRDDLLFRIKTTKPDALFNMSEYYYNDISTHAGDLAGFMLDKKYEDIITNKLTLTPSQKIQDFVVFADDSVCYKTGGEYKLVVDKDDYNKVFTELEHSIIDYQLRKKPKLANYISKLYKESLHRGQLESVLIVIDTYLKNEQILKNMKFDFSVFESNSFESIDDYMNELINKHKLNQYANSILSNKNKHLLNDASLEQFKVLMDSGVSKSVIQNLVGKKLAAIHTPEEFEKYLEKVIEHVSGFTEEALMNKLDGNGIQPVYNENKVIVFEVKTFDQSKSLGSPSWCISRNDYYFNDYTSNDSKQYFLYDFNRSEKDNQSMIGFTVQINGELRTQHARNDDYHSVDEFLSKIVNKIIYTNKQDYQLDQEKLTSLEKEFAIKTKNNLKKVPSL